MCAWMPPIWGNFLVKSYWYNFSPEGKMWKIFTYKKPSSGRILKFGLRYRERNGPVSKSAKFGHYIFNGLGCKWFTVFGSGQMAGVKMYFDTRAPHIAPKSLKRSLAPGLLNSSTLGVIGVEIPSTFSGRCCRCLDPDFSAHRAVLTACTHGC